MRTLIGQAVAVVILAGFPGVSHSAEVGSPESTLSITLHVQDYAEVSPRILMEAEKVTTAIFQKVGVEVRWVYFDATAEGNHEDAAGSFSNSHIQINILPRSIAVRFGRASGVLGQAPEHSQMVYIFHNQVEELSRSQMRAHMEGTIGRYASESQILGHAIAHELGHVLISAAHAPTGIMRGFWDRKDLLDASYQSLVFTSQQAELIRADVGRRHMQLQAVEVAKLAAGN